MGSLNIQDILRAQNVQRWNIVQTANKQSLAEHTFNVTMIARALCVEMKVNDTLVIKMALEHDLDEVKTGDIPAPAKRNLNISPPEEFSYYKDKSYPMENGIVKMADMIESLWFIKENAVGRHAKVVADNMEMAYNSFLNDAPKELTLAAITVKQRIDSGELFNE